MNKERLKWENELKRELEFYFSPEGTEFQLCLVAQGYDLKLFWRLALIFGSEFTAAKIIVRIREELKNEN